MAAAADVIVAAVAGLWLTGPVRFLSALSCCLLACAGSPAHAAAPTMPGVLRPLIGCWRGDGNAIGKAVTVQIEGRPILLGSMLALDVDSAARADPGDRYEAHLLFGADGVSKTPNAVSAFWADSFGGGATTTGRGNGTRDGLEISYRYPDAEFINHWMFDGARLTWTIVARGADAKEKPFARYLLNREDCSKGR